MLTDCQLLFIFKCTTHHIVDSFEAFLWLLVEVDMVNINTDNIYLKLRKYTSWQLSPRIKFMACFNVNCKHLWILPGKRDLKCFGIHFFVSWIAFHSLLKNFNLNYTRIFMMKKPKAFGASRSGIKRVDWWYFALKVTRFPLKMFVAKLQTENCQNSKGSEKPDIK